MPDAAPDNIAELVAQKLSDVEIGRLLGVADRTVLRWRNRRGIASQWEPKRTELVHGTVAGYHRGCRCRPCTVAHTANFVANRRERYAATRRDGLPAHIAHGTKSAYKNWGCRCPLCKAAGSVANRENKENRKKRGLKS